MTSPATTTRAASRRVRPGRPRARQRMNANPGAAIAYRRRAMSLAASPWSSSTLITENEPAQTTTTASTDRWARDAIDRDNAGGLHIVRRTTRAVARYFLRAREPRGVRGRLCRRHLHAGPGHRAHDPEHAGRREAGGTRDGGRRLARPGGVDARRERRRRGAPAGVRACVSRAQAGRRRLPGLPRRPGPLGGCRTRARRKASTAGDRGRADGAEGTPSGRAVEPRQPEDGDLLREPPARSSRPAGARRSPRCSRSGFSSRR